VSISFKQSKHALNIDSNGHQKQNKKRFKTTTTKTYRKKHVCYISTSGIVQSISSSAAPPVSQHC